MRQRKVLTGILIAFLLLCITFIVVRSGWTGEAGRETPQKLRQVTLTGEINVDGQGWQPITDAVSVDVNTHHRLKVRGHFSEDIAPNEQLLVWLSNVLFTVRINGSLLFSLEPAPDQFLKSPGNGWADITSPGITTADMVEIELSNVYIYGNPETFSGFFENIYVGDGIELSRLLTRQYGGAVLLAFLMTASGILISVVGLSIREADRKPIIYLGLFSVSIGIWNLIDFHYINLFFHSTTVLTTLSQLSQFLLPVFFAGFLLPSLDGKRKMLLNTIHICNLLLLAVSTLLQVLGIRDYYEFNFFYIIIIYGMFTTLPFLILWQALVTNDKSIWNTFCSVSPLCLLVIAELILFNQGKYFSAVLVRTGYMIFIFIQFYNFINKINLQRTQIIKAKELEQELTQSRISLMISQIQPHFLYNTLASIKALCMLDPNVAQETIDEFSEYLRGNLNSLTQMQPIPFSREMQHVKTYLAIEQKRFGEHIKIIYDIQYADFFIPALTLQPMVENAVRHGLTKKDEGGNLIIHTESTKEGALITITDNGTGFDPDRPCKEDRQHLGIKNVRGRLSAMCNGIMEIESCIGEGTTVTILIP